MRRLISSGSSFEAEIGYSRAVADGEWVFVSGTTGFDYATMTISSDVATQAEQALANVAQALREADAGFSDVVRVRYILPVASDFEASWPVLRRCFGNAPCRGTRQWQGFLSPYPDIVPCFCRGTLTLAGYFVRARRLAFLVVR